MISSPTYFRNVSLGLLSFGLMLPCFALEPEPRKWNHIPLGASFAGGAYAYTDADIVFDPTLKLEDVKMHLNTWGVKYIHAFELLGKSARIDITQAYQKGKWTGLLDATRASTKRSGWSDTFVRLAVNLYGAPPLKAKKFSAYRAKTKDETIVGVALNVRLPTGGYMADKLINLGQNRFVFQPQVGVIHTHGKWTAEVTSEVAFYTENDEFFNGNRLEQKPLYILHAHVIRNFRPGQWVGVSIAYDNGGENTLNGIDKKDKKQNIGWALSYSHPITPQTGIKIAYIGTRTKKSTGFDSETLAVSAAFAW
jgi:hypothetical protein